VDFTLTSTQQDLRRRAREFADSVLRDRAARWDAEEAYPWDNVKDLVRAGFETFAAEMAQQVTSQALQIHGAAGYGRALPLERMMRDARMFAIGGGTVEMMRNLIADRVLAARDHRR
jgi:alkylation response protein AidB-like acyl-CoA dehydrogenase